MAGAKGETARVRWGQRAGETEGTPEARSFGQGRGHRDPPAREPFGWRAGQAAERRQGVGVSGRASRAAVLPCGLKMGRSLAGRALWRAAVLCAPRLRAREGRQRCLGETVPLGAAPGEVPAPCWAPGGGARARPARAARDRPGLAVRVCPHTRCVAGAWRRPWASGGRTWDPEPPTGRVLGPAAVHRVAAQLSGPPEVQASCSLTRPAHGRHRHTLPCLVDC